MDINNFIINSLDDIPLYTFEFFKIILLLFPFYFNYYNFLISLHCSRKISLYKNI